MSVLKSNRNKSDIQFLETAREIELFIYRITKHFPKRYNYTLSAQLIQVSQSLLNNLKAANSIYPINAHELQIRRDYWIYANNSLQCLISQCGIAKELVTDVKSSSWEQLVDLKDIQQTLQSILGHLKKVIRMIYSDNYIGIVNSYLIISYK